jgi:hypothetical protein
MLPRFSRVALLALCAGGIAVAATHVTHAAHADLSPDQQAAMLTAHNTVRRNVAAAETQRLGMTVTIPDLTWNPAAAAIAQGWANNLLATNTFQHNPNLNGYGENIYMSSGLSPATAGTAAVQDWAAEAAAYTWDTNGCTAVCGHYTQLVWAATTSVGCGLATDGTNTYVVCDYAPPGNFVGQRPYEPGGPANGPAPANPQPNPPAGNPPPATALTLTGSWTVDDFGQGVGGTLSLVQTGNQVAGVYSYPDPSGCGMENGTLTGTFDGTTLNYTVIETGCGGGGQGGGTEIVSPDGNSMQGAFNATRGGM